uniref:Reverse transcriptase domain-containing protein n=1 Tax=Trichogramma kaykai TaxID=54128 RepID=A0ABD2VXN7_9HYME
MLQATEYSDELRTLINDRSLHLIPSGPTHFRNSTATWIDLMIVDSGDTVVDYRVSDAPIAFGHCTTFLLYRFAVRSFESRVVSFRNFARCNVNALQSSLSDRLSGTFNLSSDHDPSDALDAVSTSVLAEFDLFAPGISRPFRRPPAPWMTDALRAECRQRDRLFQRARRLGSADLMNRYRTMRRELRSRMLCARRDYLNRCLEEQPDQAAVWRLLERHGVTVSRSSSAVGSLSLDELNEFYRGVASVHRPCSLAQLANIIAVEPFQTDSRFSFTPVTAMEMGRIFNDCVRRSRGRSSDGLTLQYLSHIWLVLLPYIDKLFNFCLSSSAYPDSWRRAFIVPLNTVSSPVSLADTRPIVNLPHLAKMFDRLFTRQMLNYLESNELILPNQFSFRSSHSIQHALLHLTDIVRAGIDDGLVTLLMLFDLRKAFDTADHVALLRCLRSLGFSDSALTFVPSYITRRTQVVIGSDGSSSDFMTVTSGVPQGSSPRAGVISCRHKLSPLVSYVL